MTARMVDAHRFDDGAERIAAMLKIVELVE